LQVSDAAGFLPRVLVLSLCQRRRSIALVSGQHGPGDARGFVGNGYRGQAGLAETFATFDARFVKAARRLGLTLVREQGNAAEALGAE
jgi:hypothetical protein